MRAIDNVREVYGVRGIRFNEKDRSIRVEFDASRFKEPVIAALLRQAGIDIQENLALASSYSGEEGEGRTKMQGDVKENFWPKIILVNVPVARHFV